MDPQYAKNICQNLIFIGAFFSLVGSVGIWWFGLKVDERKKLDGAEKEALIEKRTSERDAAITQIRETSMLTAELDTPVRYALFRVFLKQNYSAAELDGFRVFVSFTPYNQYYDLSILPASIDSQRSFSFSTLAGPPDKFADRPYGMVNVGPAKPLSFFSWDLLGVLHSPPKLRLKDLHMGAVSIAVSKGHCDKIIAFDILSNDWIVAQFPVSDPWPNSRANPVVDAIDKDSFVTFQFDSKAGYKQNLKLINLFDGSVVKSNARK